MTRALARLLAAGCLWATILLGTSGSAHAWYKVRNNTANTAWVAHAFASTSGFLCGYNDGCDDRTTKGWRVEGWWMIAPGATVTIHSKGFGNAIHQLYANDFVGHVWGGTGDAFGSPDPAFGRCEGLFTDFSIPYYTYIWTAGLRCCGGSCTSNHITNLSL